MCTLHRCVWVCMDVHGCVGVCTGPPCCDDPTQSFTGFADVSPSWLVLSLDDIWSAYFQPCSMFICEDHVVIIILGKKPLVWQVVTVEMLDGRARRQQAVSGEQDFLLLLPMLMVMLMLILLLMRMIC